MLNFGDVLTFDGGVNQFEVVYYIPGIFGAFLCIQARQKFEFGE